MGKVLIIHYGLLGDIVSGNILVNYFQEQKREIHLVVDKTIQTLFLDEEYVTPMDIEEAFKNSYELLIDLNNFKRTRKLVRKIKAKQKLSYYRRFRHKLESMFYYNKLFPKNVYNNIVKDFYPFLDFLQNSKEDNRLPYLLAPQNEDVKQEFESHFNGKEIVGIHIDASHPIRYLPEDTVVRVIEELEKKNLGVFLIGLDEERIKTFQKRSNNYAFYKKYSLQDLKTVMKSLKLFIGTDSGIIHLAMALDIPSIGFYGPQLSEVSGTHNKKLTKLEKSLDCRPCGYNKDCEFNKECFNLDLNSVLDSLNKALN